MTIEKNVLVKLKVEGGGRDGQAFGEAAKNSQKLETQTKRTGAVIADMVKEMRKTRDADREIERVAKQLQSMGVAADKAKEAAKRLFQEVGHGAKVAEQDVRRLATGMKATGQAGGGGGWAGRLGLQNGMPSLGRIAGATGTLMALGRAGTRLQESLGTSADAGIQEQIREADRARSMGTKVKDAFLEGLADIIPGLRGILDGLTAAVTAAEREATARSNTETQRATQRAELRRRVGIAASAALAAEDLDRQELGGQTFRSQLAAGLAPMAGAETATVRAAAIRQQEVMAGQLVTRDGQVTREPSMDAARQAMASRPQQGGAAMAGIDAERQELLRQAAEARRVGQLGQGGTARAQGADVALDR